MNLVDPIYGKICVALKGWKYVNYNHKNYMYKIDINKNINFRDDYKNTDILIDLIKKKHKL